MPRTRWNRIAALNMTERVTNSNCSTLERLASRLRQTFGRTFPILLSQLSDLRYTNMRIAEFYEVEVYQVALWRKVLVSTLRLPREIEAEAAKSPVQIIHINPKRIAS